MAKKIRLKVTLGGLEIVVPEGRQPEESSFGVIAFRYEWFAPILGTAQTG